jgi:NhaA family Na+:H+ antiporter
LEESVTTGSSFLYRGGRLKIREAVSRRLPRPIREFVRTEVSGGIVLLIAALVAMAWANSPIDGVYNDIFEQKITVDGGIFRIEEDVRHWINDALMTLFFFVVGLEIKRELMVGELAGVDRAALPVVAAIGGMVVPALIYTAINFGGDGGKGWGIPMATDIAFALGVLALFGRRIPTPLRTFLLALAIADDIGAILVIAVFYTDSLQVDSLAIAAGIFAVIIAMKTFGVKNYAFFVLAGAGAWVAVFESGIHATLSGVALGLMTPLGIETTEGEEDSILVSSGPLEDLESLLHPLSSFFIVPLFALANAGVSLDPNSVSDSAGEAVTIGVALGLLIGKPLGIVLATLLALRLGVGKLPASVNMQQVLGVGFIAGIGFTVALFVNGLAFTNPDLQEQGRLGIVAGSLVASLVGAAILWRFSARSPGLLVDDDLGV